jgi:ElaB/YqjD/DUF883 family membrane-anchored ribosome-binding protein
MTEEVFDALCEEIREQGFDEPILVRESTKQPGYYEIGSGHHRWKAANVIGMDTVPCIVKEWSDTDLTLALTKRNVLRGNVTDKSKLAKIYEQLVKEMGDATVAQKAMGFHNKKAFETLLDQAKKTMTATQRKKLDAAKETIKSVDDLSSVLNSIFKESGSELDKGYMVFSFGGKHHHYFQIDEVTHANLGKIKKKCEDSGMSYAEAMQSIVADAIANGFTTTKPEKKRIVRKGGNK